MLAEESLETLPSMGLGVCKDIKKNLRSYLLQESLLNIRKEKERPP